MFHTFYNAEDINTFTDNQSDRKTDTNTYSNTTKINSTFSIYRTREKKFCYSMYDFKNTEKWPNSQIYLCEPYYFYLQKSSTLIVYSS